MTGSTTARQGPGPATSRPSEEAAAFIARQPIFNDRDAVCAYELLFRSGEANAYGGDLASFQTINNALHLTPLNVLTNGQRGFVNFTRSLLLSEAYTLLPRDKTVVELLETVKPDKTVIEACRRLKQAGYMLALDDFIFEPGFEPLVRLADIVKVDFLATRGEAREAVAQRCREAGTELLAEKVETGADQRDARRLGYQYLQGYFYCQPQIIASRDLRAAKSICLQFLEQVNRFEIDFDELERVIKRDTSFSYKLLRYVSSAAMGVGQRVNSIRQALVLLGEEQLRRWGSLVALTGLGEDKPAELLVSCLVRAAFCERIAGPAGFADQREEFFLMGLLSGLNAVMDRPMLEVIDGVPLGDDVKAALLGQRNAIRPVYQLARACERGDWDRVEKLTAELGLPADRTASAHREALLWADQMFQTVNG